MSELLNTLRPRWQKLPRAAQWLVIAVIGVLAFQLWDMTLRQLNQQWTNEADAIEEDVRTVRNSADLADQFRSRALSEAVLSTGAVELPGTPAEGKDRLNQVVNSLLNEFRVSDDSFVIRSEGKLPKSALKSITNGGRVETIRGNLDFESTPDDATAIIAALESDPAIECLRSLSMTKSAVGKVKVRLVLEAWVISPSTSRRAGAL